MLYGKESLETAKDEILSGHLNRITAGVAAASLIAASWIVSSYYPATWVGFCLFFLLALYNSPRLAFLCGSLMGAFALGWAFLWAPETLGLQFDLTPLVAWPLFYV